MKAAWFLAVFLACGISFREAIAADAEQPTAGGSATIPEKSNERSDELLVRIGNESNPVDGAFGPFTYGLRGAHKFSNSTEIEAGYIRLHEPSTPTFNSVVDEAQLSVRSPEVHIAQQPLVLAATAWQNRLIDMYTNVGGVEFTRPGEFGFFLGAYIGSATREDAKGRFLGGQIGVTRSLGPVDLSLAHMAGKIDENGSYRKTALEASMDVSHPLTLNLSVEARYFNFGNGGPESEPKDEFIFVTALELHLEKLF